MVVGKIKPSGDWDWVRVATGGESEALDISIHNNDLYIVGNYETSLTFGGKTASTASGYFDEGFILKMDTDGTTAWIKKVSGSNNQRVMQVANGSDGSVYISGEYSTQAIVGSETYTTRGERDFFAAKMSASGAFTWTADFGSSGIDRMRKLAISSNDEIVILGSSRTDLELGDGTVLTSPNAAKDDAFIVLLNSAGSFTRYGLFGGSEAAEGSAASFSSDGVLHFSINYDEILYLGSTSVGSSGGDWGYAMLALYPNNQLYLEFANSADLFLEDIQHDENDLIHFTGSQIMSTMSLDADVKFWKIDWIDQTQFTFDVETFGSPEGWDQPYMMHLDNSGNVYIAGEHENTLYFAGGQFASTAPQMCMAVKFENLGDTTNLGLHDAKTFNSKELQVYPNPSSGMIKVYIPIDVSEVEIFSLEGRKMLDLTSSSRSLSVDVSKLPKGIYIVTAKSKDINYHQRFILN